MCAFCGHYSFWSVCFLISMSHSVHTLGLANFGVFRLSDYFFYGLLSLIFCVSRGIDLY
ncbi:hypothetical protein CsSME_00037538 [Camellia sinensis var. sinensis]